MQPLTRVDTTIVKKVMISSTIRDLPEHRKVVLDACLRQGMFPLMMEYLPASDADAIRASLKMVDEADIYLGVFAYRYGYVPKGCDISITEMEYNQAVKRSIPRLIFFIHEDHPIKIADVEMGEGATKLKALKERLQVENIVNFFTSPADLGTHAINSLSHYRQVNLTAFHYVSDVPTPPKPYIAHPYTLLQTTSLIGRQDELKLLTDWVADSSSEVYRDHILSIIAIGGMGKSALTWKWFNDIAPYEMLPLTGRIWWSFYESDASFENFIIRALAYVVGQSKEDIQKIPPLERESQLLSILNREPYLIVLDGLERILIAYASMDAARLIDNDFDQRATNVVTRAVGLPNSASYSFTEQHRLRKTADPRVSTFLRKLANVQAARILFSSRLYPVDLETDSGSERLGCRAVFLHGLTDDDASSLWRAFGVSGSREILLPLFHKFDNHPLLIQVLAGEVAHDRRAPGDYNLWRESHLDFNPFRLPLVQAQSHVLAFALRGLDELAQEVLFIVAGFRMPATYDTLVALLVGKGKSFQNENTLVAALAELEDRGLLGWDRRANRYDLHPVVRGVIWSVLGIQAKKGIYQRLNQHFKSLRGVKPEQEVNYLEDLTVTIELYNTLIGLKRYDDAARLFSLRLEKAMLYRLSANRQCAELLEMLFPKGLDEMPPLDSSGIQSHILNSLANSVSDQPGRAAVLFRRSIDIDEKVENKQNISIGLSNLANVLCLSGALRESESVARRGMHIARQLRAQALESYSLCWLGVTLTVRGIKLESAKAFNRSFELIHLEPGYKAYDFQAMHALWFGQYSKALKLSNRAMAFCQRHHYEMGVIRSTRLRGAVFLCLDDLSMAEAWLYQALIRARKVNFVEEELHALTELAKVRRRLGDLKAARELLDDLWESAERGPFRLIQADAFNVLAQIERDAGDYTAAIKAATAAYRLAWCDGPPFAYHWGLQAAKAHISILGVQEPVLRPFDTSKYESMSDID